MGNANNMVVAQMARVFLATVGTPAPLSPTSVMPAPWREVGLFTPDSLAWATAPSFEEIRSHQSNYPTRRIQTEDAATVSVDLQEWSGPNFQAVYGGGQIVVVPAVTTGVDAHPEYYRFSPPQVGGRQTVAACIELIDGIKHYRRMVPLCEQNEGVEQAFPKTSESTLPLRLAILGADIGDPWYDINDDPSFNPVAA